MSKLPDGWKKFWQVDETVRHYEVATLEHDGTNAYLRVAPDRKRKFPVYVKLPEDLAKMAIAGVTADPRLVLENRQLRAASEERLTRISNLADDVQHWKDCYTKIGVDYGAAQARIAELQARLEELQVGFIHRGQGLNSMREAYDRAEEQRIWLVRHYEKVCSAVRSILNRVDDETAATGLWREMYLTFRSALVRHGYHERGIHPIWSRHFYTGCPKCVPVWMLLEPHVLSDEESAPIKSVVDHLERKMADVLGPALRAETPAPRT